MVNQAEHLRQKLSICRRAPRFSRYPVPIRQEAMNHVCKRSEQGASPGQLAEELGVSLSTVVAWLKRGLPKEEHSAQVAASEAQQPVSFARVVVSPVKPASAHAQTAATAMSAGVMMQMALSDGTTIRLEGLSERGALEAVSALRGAGLSLILQTIWAPAQSKRTARQTDVVRGRGPPMVCHGRHIHRPASLSQTHARLRARVGLRVALRVVPVYGKK